MPVPIQNQPNKNTNGFDKNPQNINSTGLNRKSFASINKTMKEKGIEPLTKSDFVEAYTLIFNSTEEELKQMVSDPEIPYVLKLILNELNSGRTRSQALKDYRDYMFGRAQEHLDTTTGGKSMQPVVVVDAGIHPDFFDENGQLTYDENGKVILPKR